MRSSVRRLALLALAALPLAACSDRASGQARQPARPAVPVTVSDAVAKDVPVQLTAIGTVQAYTSVVVKCLVNGQVAQVSFKEGEDVRKGQVLFTLDQRPFEATLRQAEANVGRDRAALSQAEASFKQRQAEVLQAEAALARDQAQMDNARVQEKRYRDLVDKELVAREQYDQIRTNMSAMEATVRADAAGVENARAALNATQASVENARAVIRADEAVVDSARVQLSYTVIRAPMDGRTGNVTAFVGTVVKANDDNGLVTINQVHPVYVSFALPQQFLADVKKYRALGALAVDAAPAQQRQGATRGEVTFVNNAVDTTTGTIQLKATFANGDNVLWPGQYADVTLTLTTEPNVVVVPSQAVQNGQNGTYVFVVKPDLTVESRPVEVARRLATEMVIGKGLRAGERVVTDGQLKLVPGAKVDVKKPA
ncbi:MAG TPA: efflux RND transporter periplasmic adaptor subunit [Methylomirabilota bacterium]|nr:efflux RND transporter periplasmic adaptor subunit [Methylomirabilota bacterium]